MTDQKLAEFHKRLHSKINIMADEVAAIFESKDWRLLKSYFYHLSTPEDRAVGTIIWGRLFLPHYFKDNTPDFHYDLCYSFFTPENEYDAAPRGFAKTTLEQACISISLVNGWEKFIVIIEKTYTEAGEVLDAIRAEFAENKLILEVYGDLIGKLASGDEPDKSKDAEGDVLINGIRLRCKGFNSSIRGMKSRENRPSLILCTDIEEDEHIENEDQRRKYRDNYTKGIVPAPDLKGRIKVRGTILHQDSLLNNLIQQHHGRIYSAFDPRLNIDTDREQIEKTLLWPERWSYDELRKKHEEMLLAGMGSSRFYQEYLNIVLDDASRTFHYDWLQKTFTDADIKYKTRNRTACFDVAQSKNKGSDWTFLTVVDQDSGSDWYVQHAKRRKVNSPDLIEWIFFVWTTYKPSKIGVEQLAFEDQVEPWLKEKSEKEGIYPVVVALDPMGKRKEDRVKGALQGRFQSGKIHFKEGATDDTPILKGELYDFPMGKNDDGPDSLAYHDQIGSRPYSMEEETDLSSIADYDESSGLKV